MSAKVNAFAEGAALVRPYLYLEGVANPFSTAC